MSNLSVLDRRWVIKPANQQSIESLCQKKNLSTNFYSYFSTIHITNYIRRFSLLEGRKESQFFETAQVNYTKQ